MKRVSTSQIQRNQSLQTDAMDDLCHIAHITRSSGTYSTQSTETRSLVTGVACGIQFTNGQIKQGGQVLLVDYDAVLRLPANQPIFVTDEIELVEKGEYVVTGTFRPASNPVVNNSVQRVQLKRQT